ncbi:MAG: putative Ig domain-containing protein, partial [Tepidisphaeraceae bacterium]
MTKRVGGLRRRRALNCAVRFSIEALETRRLLVATGLIDVQFNVTGNANYANAAQVGPVVVGTPGDTWNQIQSPDYFSGSAASPLTGSNLSMLDSGGNTTPVTLSYTAQFATEPAAGPGAPFAGTAYQSLMNAYLAADSQFGGAPTPGNVTFNGLTANGDYILCLYSGADENGRVTTFTVGGIAENTTFDTSQSAFVNGVNYVEFSATADSNGQLVIGFDAAGGADEGDLNGIQLQAVTSDSPINVYPLNNGFESPNLGNNSGDFDTDPTVEGWVFTGGAGILTNGENPQGYSNGYNLSGASDGNSDGTTSTLGQAAYLQIHANGGLAPGMVAQSIPFPAGNAVLTYDDEGRPGQNGGAGAYGPASIDVYLDNQLVGSTTPASTASFGAESVDLGSVTAGYHTLTFVAASTANTDRTSFIDNVAISVDQAATITSPSAVIFPPGVNTRFTVTTTGFPTPALSEDGVLPDGITFVDNGDGTATLSGIPIVGTAGNYSLSLSATNGVSPDATQAFALTVEQTPSSGSFNVSATANIFGAGHSSAPAPGGGSGGVLPPVFTFSPGAGQVITFPSVSGAATITPGEPATGGDGGTILGTNISSFGGLSGIEDDQGLGFLVGVFLDNTEPVDPAPAALNFTGDTGFATLSPLLDQTFFIGDGLTGNGSGSLQTFTVPATATRLFLGFADGNNIQGPPGEYQDNVGSLTVDAELNEISGEYPDLQVQGLNATPSNPVAGQQLTINWNDANTGDGAANGPWSDSIQVVNTTTETTLLDTTQAYSNINIAAGNSAAQSYSFVLPGGIAAVGNLQVIVTVDSNNAVFEYNTSGTGYSNNSASLAVTVAPSNSTSFTSGPDATFVVGSSTSFTVTTTGAPTAAISESSELPSGLAFVDNGDGTATIFGTPASGTSGVYDVTLTADNGVTPDSNQALTLAVDQAPSITSGVSATFTSGTRASFTVNTAGFPAAALTETGVLPSGVTFRDERNGTAILSGTPTEVGTFPLTITAANGISPNADQSFSLTVIQAPGTSAPTITSAASIIFAAGLPGSFTVNASGVPNPSLMETGALPDGITFTDNGDGTASLAGNASLSSAAKFPLMISASNNVGSPFVQSFTLTVEVPTITQSDGVITGDGTDLNDVASISYSDGNVIVTIDALTDTFALSSVTGINIDLGLGNDSITLGAGVPAVNFNGGAGNDSVIANNSAADTLAGGAGDDRIVGGGKGSSLSGNGGNDILAPENRHETVNGGGGNDTVSGAGHDSMRGGAGDDIFLDGGVKKDSINGGAGLNFAQYNPTDVMSNIYEAFDPPAPATPSVNGAVVSSDLSELSADSLVGGTADASGVVSAGVVDGELKVTGTSGPDVISVTLNGAGTKLKVVGNGASAGSFKLSGLTGIHANGGPGADSITIGSTVTLPATLLGNGGADTLVGGDGDNVLIGGAGGDSLVGGAGTNLLVPDGNTSFLTGPAGNDTLDGGTGFSIADFSRRTDALTLSNNGV